MNDTIGSVTERQHVPSSSNTVSHYISVYHKSICTVIEFQQ
jgi:hypothetical protein